MFGIPFDFTAQAVKAPPAKPDNLVTVRAVSPARDALEIRFPRVDGYRFELPQERVTARFDDNSSYDLNPLEVSATETTNTGIVGETADFTLKHLDGEAVDDHCQDRQLFHRTLLRRRGRPAQAAPVPADQDHRPRVEEFFIKNLENVQGDERDIILISTVYGPNKDGKVLQYFGLMNREVGWRRLNVLVTRAKRSTRLFTSLRPDDVKVTPTSSRGVRAFKAYLTYAHGGASYADATGGEPDSDFEVFVADALKGAGYDVVHQVGVEGFRIDLGVRHVDYPVGFIAGVECDGASFHRGLTVRDRDRIRQSVLEGMGWKIYRIWSTDWFADPARELARLLAFLEEQRKVFAAAYSKRPEPSDDDPDPEPQRPPAPDALTASTEPPLPHVTAESVEPAGRAMRPLEDITWYETVQGRSYDVWLGGRRAGDVEVLSRATAAPRLYGNQIVVARSEYEGHVEATGEQFRSHDIHAAVREVARRAQASMDEVVRTDTTRAPD